MDEEAWPDGARAHRERAEDDARDDRADRLGDGFPVMDHHIRDDHDEDCLASVGLSARLDHKAAEDEFDGEELPGVEKLPKEEVGITSSGLLIKRVIITEVWAFRDDENERDDDGRREDVERPMRAGLSPPQAEIERISAKSEEDEHGKNDPREEPRDAPIGVARETPIGRFARTLEQGLEVREETLSLHDRLLERAEGRAAAVIFGEGEAGADGEDHR